MPYGRDASGFTLIEVLLAMGIAALLFTATFMGIDQVIRSRKAIANRSTPYVIGPAILDAISADLSNAYFYDLKDNNVFFGSEAELGGREADALSFISARRTYAPERFESDEDLRHSFLNEVGYLMRTGATDTPFLELWRREDYFVDGNIHEGGDYVMVYDKVHSLSLQYVSSNPENRDGGGQKAPEEMLQDGWNSIDEKGVPRAVQITLTIFAPDTLEAVDREVKDGRARLYTFKRFVSLPQVHMSTQSQQQVADWDGNLAEPIGQPTGVARGGQGEAGKGGATATATSSTTIQSGTSQRPTPGANQGGANALLEALRNRGRPSGGSGGTSGLGALFGGGGG